MKNRGMKRRNGEREGNVENVTRWLAGRNNKGEEDIKGHVNSGAHCSLIRPLIGLFHILSAWDSFKNKL